MHVAQGGAGWSMLRVLPALFSQLQTDMHLREPKSSATSTSSTVSTFTSSSTSRTGSLLIRKFVPVEVCRLGVVS